jgi:hypothetical protein
MECLGLRNTPKAEVRLGHKLTGLKKKKNNNNHNERSAPLLGDYVYAKLQTQ